MKTWIPWLDGKKTYILSGVIIVYAILAYAGVVPEPDKVIAAAIVVAGYAVTLRSAWTKFYAEIPKK